MIKINSFKNIENATNKQLKEYFAQISIRKTAVKIEMEYGQLKYYLRKKRGLNLTNYIKLHNPKFIRLRKLNKNQIIELCKQKKIEELAADFQVSVSFFYTILRKHNIILSNLLLKNNTKFVNNKKLYLYCDRKEFIKTHCFEKCKLWTNNKNIQYWNPSECFKYGCISFLKTIDTYLQYNKNNDTVFCIIREKKFQKFTKYFDKNLWIKKTLEYPTSYYL